MCTLHTMQLKEMAYVGFEGLQRGDHRTQPLIKGGVSVEQPLLLLLLLFTYQCDEGLGTGHVNHGSEHGRGQSSEKGRDEARLASRCRRGMMIVRCLRGGGQRGGQGGIV